MDEQKEEVGIFSPVFFLLFFVLFLPLWFPGLPAFFAASFEIPWRRLAARIICQTRLAAEKETLRCHGESAAASVAQASG